MLCFKLKKKCTATYAMCPLITVVWGHQTSNDCHNRARGFYSIWLYKTCKKWQTGKQYSWYCLLGRAFNPWARRSYFKQRLSYHCLISGSRPLLLDKWMAMKAFQLNKWLLFIYHCLMVMNHFCLKVTVGYKFHLFHDCDTNIKYWWKCGIWSIQECLAGYVRD